jgi:hypothetical protein
MMRDDCDYQERAAIMQFCGGLSKAEAERLARERPWDKDPYWGMPKPEQMKLGDIETADEFWDRMQRLYGGR